MILTQEQTKKQKQRNSILLTKVINITNVEYEQKDISCLELVEDLVKVIENYKECFNLTFVEFAKDLPMYEKSIISDFERKYFKNMEEINGKRT